MEGREHDPRDREVFRRLAELFDMSDGGEPDYGPPVDVVEHADRIEITLDLPGVSADSIRILFSRGTVVIAGKKLPPSCGERVVFHLAERSFGRFVRAITLTGACDAGRGTASLSGGELRVVLPRIDERRGRDIPIAVAHDPFPRE